MAARTFDEMLAEATGRSAPSAVSISNVSKTSEVTATETREDPFGSVLVPSTWFAEGWHGRTTEPQRIAFRLVSESTVEAAQITAVRQSWEAYPNAGDEGLRSELATTYVMQGILAKACVHADSRLPFFGKVAEDAIRIALSTDGTRRLWTAFELFCRDRAEPVLSASDEELSDIAVAFNTGVVETLSAGAQRRVRMLAALIRIEL